MKNHIGIIGLGVMGRSIALNFMNHGVHLSVYNKTVEKTERFMKEHPNVLGTFTLLEFVQSLEKPRKVLLMVSANAVDSVVEQLLALLEEKDIIIDGGNSFYLDTERRMEACKNRGIDYIGMGISGGEEGALIGPSMMPSGSYQAYLELEKLLESISAKQDEGKPCVAYIGSGGSGHFVKMVHNGIEYADMQLISEAVGLLKHVGYSNDEIAHIFEKWNQGKLKSYLMKITVDILRHKENDEYLIDKIKDVVYHKGTGKWTSLTGIETDVAIPSLIEAMQVRILTQKDRVFDEYSLVLEAKKNDQLVDDLENALYLSKMMVYVQGFDLIETMSNKKNWEIDLETLTLIWQSGCIIQSDFLKELQKSLHETNQLFLSSLYQKELLCHHQAWRKSIIKMIEVGNFAPVMFSTLAYFDGLRQQRLSTNIIQAQRDYFGAHTYERIDQNGFFHTEWKK